MNSLLYVIALILIIGWAVAFFFTAVGSLIHVVLVLAVIAFLFGIIRRPTAV
ncbi:lmo0937 family membrane protein [Mucilaginibacter phyllosphaerae]|uniref:Membrane protein n=1 Tax=Mucilaginibacter phyllosphaerae TaxID=1812349 RepID=A0A4Y8A9Z6_9SPHI|nr:lmo0937 family membrane protein [Mucilaginibacter phyllosphaerae]MBB3969890.1 putative membrane protein [Mucilaginibacter phyllosphaerae]TEW65264.1 lmo0937 family membrane protein [Mucilaginibacter phyllosphaerae]